MARAYPETGHPTAELLMAVGGHCSLRTGVEEREDQIVAEVDHRSLDTAEEGVGSHTEERTAAGNIDIAVVAAVRRIAVLVEERIAMRTAGAEVDRIG